MSSEDKEIAGLCDKLDSEHLDEEPTSSEDGPTQLQEMEEGDKSGISETTTPSSVADSGDKSGTSETATPSSVADSGDKSGTSETATPSSGANSSGCKDARLKSESDKKIFVLEPTEDKGVYTIRECRPDELESARSQMLDEESITLGDRIAVQVKIDAEAFNHYLNSRPTEREESAVSAGSNVSSCGKSSDCQDNGLKAEEPQERRPDEGTGIPRIRLIDGKGEFCLRDGDGGKCDFCAEDKSNCKKCSPCGLYRLYVKAACDVDYEKRKAARSREATASNQSLDSRPTEREECAVSAGSNVSSCGKSSDDVDENAADGEDESDEKPSPKSKSPEHSKDD